MLARTDTIQCIEKRALQFQGYPTDVFIERIWAQKYDAGGHYSHHFDWSGELYSRGAGRISTFMVYVQAPEKGGGTHFPRLERPASTDWCSVLHCPVQDVNQAGAVLHTEQDNDLGIVFTPVAGSAVYWENFRPDGRGWEELWHSGLPVEKGTKVGLNIWSWYQPGYSHIYRSSLDHMVASDEVS